MSNLIWMACMFIFFAWIFMNMCTLYKTIKAYKKWIYVYGSKKHSNEHIALLYWSSMVAILFILWIFWHWGLAHSWNTHILDENLWFLFFFMWAVYYFIAKHLLSELME